MRLCTALGMGKGTRITTTLETDHADSQHSRRFFRHPHHPPGSRAGRSSLEAPVRPVPRFAHASAGVGAQLKTAPRAANGEDDVQQPLKEGE